MESVFFPPKLTQYLQVRVGLIFCSGCWKARHSARPWVADPEHLSCGGVGPVPGGHRWMELEELGALPGYLLTVFSLWLLTTALLGCRLLRGSWDAYLMPDLRRKMDTVTCGRFGGRAPHNLRCRFVQRSWLSSPSGDMVFHSQDLHPPRDEQLFSLCPVRDRCAWRWRRGPPTRTTPPSPSSLSGE